MIISSKSNTVVGNVIALVILTYCFYDPTLKRWIEDGVTPPLEIVLGFAFFYSLVIWLIVRAILNWHQDDEED